MKQDLARGLGLPARATIRLIRTYQKLVSPAMNPRCRFQPTCSKYAADSIGRFGVIRGTLLGLKRIARCHPMHPGGFDPVPDSWRVH